MKNTDVVDAVIADRIIDVMNSAIKLDPKAVGALVEARVDCNNALASHPSIQVAGTEGPDGKMGYQVGLLGVLCGLAGTQTYKGEPGWGRVAAIFKVCCEQCGHVKSGEMEGDPCPTCGRDLKTGAIECFKRLR